VAEEQDPPPAPPPAPQAEPADELTQLLGRDVRSPVAIPRAYRPLEVSTHSLLRVELGEFAGPLDLLLFLIRKHDLDILDIPISFITERYLEMLDTMQALPIDVAAEFLVMAAELAHIKSKMLLPPKEGVAVDDPLDEDGDPRADLVLRLLEYQKYRDAADQLNDRDRLGYHTFGRTPGDIEGDESFDPGLKPVSLFRLVETMSEVLRRLEPRAQHEVTADDITVTDRVHHILRYAKRHGQRFEFRALLEEETTRQGVVMTFLAILEMARTGVLLIEQAAEVEAESGVTPAPPILLVLTGKPPPPDLLRDDDEDP